MSQNEKPAAAKSGPETELISTTIVPQSDTANKRLNFYDWLMQYKARGAQRDFIEDSRGKEKHLSSVITFDDLYIAMCRIRREITGRYTGAGCPEAIEAGKKLICKYRTYQMDTEAALNG